MKLSIRIAGFLLVAAGLLPSPHAEAENGIANWPAPPTWSPEAVAHRGLKTTQVFSALPFVGTTPCRLVDTRGNGFGGAFGPPALVPGSPRSFTIWSQCGIPTSAAAVSLNVTVTNTQGPGFLSVYPQGGEVPLVSTLNFASGQTLANAAVVPIGTGGAIAVVAGVSGTDLLVDINGFYGSPTASDSDLFLGEFTGNAGMPGKFNTGIGSEVLGNNGTGAYNTGYGYRALELNTTGTANSAFGMGALLANPAGNNNVVIGFVALQASTASDNTAAGRWALVSNTTGIANVALGSSALATHHQSSYGIGIGFNAGGANGNGRDNQILIGAGGSSAYPANTIFFGDNSYTACVMGGVSGESSPGGSALNVESGSGGVGGLLGLHTSSVRFKANVRPVGEASDRLMRLRPVAFRYKPELDPAGSTEYGLVAEEVEQVDPGLVVYDGQGLPMTVRYPLVDALLLDLVQKQRRQIEARETRLRELTDRIAALEALLAGRRSLWPEQR